MHAFQAAKRIAPLIAALVLLVSAPLTLADDDDSRGYLGVMLQDISPSMARALQLEEDTGILVNEVVEDSPAEAAGLEDGDVILEYDGDIITGNKDLTRAVRASRPGDTVEIVVLREGRQRTIEVEVGEAEDMDLSFYFSGDDLKGLKELEHLKQLEHLDWTDDNSNVWVMGDDSNVWVSGFNNDRGFLGVHLDNLNEQLGEYFEVVDGEGALITTVVEDSPAEAAGLKAGDVIVSLDGEAVTSQGDVHDFMNDTEADQDIEVEFLRKGRTRILTVTAGEMPEPKFMSMRKSKAPHSLRRIMRQFDAPHSQHMVIDIEDDELDELREELDELKEELEELREDVQRR